MTRFVNFSISSLFVCLLLVVLCSPAQAFFGGGTVTKVEMQFDNGKTVTVDSGTNLGEACAKAGASIRYGCKEGKCGACTVKVNGAKAKPCVAKVPKSAKPVSVVTEK